MLVIDEIRAVGVYGERGSGLLEVCGDVGEAAAENVVVIGSIDGTLGGLMMGGYIVGKADTIDCIRSFGSSFIFTTALPPAVVKCASHCVAQVATNQAGRETLAAKARELREDMLAAGIPLQGSRDNPSHILFVPIGSDELCRQAAEALVRHGVLVEAILPPAAPEAGLRINPTTEHTSEMAQELLRGLRHVAGELQLWQHQRTGD